MDQNFPAPFVLDNFDVRAEELDFVPEWNGWWDETQYPAIEEARLAA